MSSAASQRSNEATALPLLDLREFNGGTPASRARFVTRLRETAHRVGFFYLQGHGLGANEVAGLFASGREFFALPRERKLALRMANSPHFRGYTGYGEEITRGAPDWREQLDIGAERALLPGSVEQAWRRLQGPNQWPAELPELKTRLLAWQEQMGGVARSLLRALALALQQPERSFEALFEPEPVQHLKLIRYPGRAPGQGQQGVGAHKDSGCLTLLQQDRQGGLQVQFGGGWIEVPPLPGSLVVNLGEVLEMLSGGYLRATLHRVVSPPSGFERLSVAYFHGPHLDAHLLPLQLPADLAAQASGVELDPLNPLVPHAGSNFLKGRLRSHLDVAQAFYADVLPTAP